MLYRIIDKIMTIIGVFTMLMPFIGLIAFFFGAVNITIVSAIVILSVLGITSIFDHGLTWIMVPIGLFLGGIGSLIAWIFNWEIIAFAAFVVCLVSVLVIVLLVLMMAKFSTR